MGRFTIIIEFFVQENNLHWENENQQNLLRSEVEDDRDNGLDEDDDANDQSSISSENSCCDILPPESSLSHQNAHVGQSAEANIWQSMPDIDDNILKELPNAERILDDLLAENWESNYVHQTLIALSINSN